MFILTENNIIQPQKMNYYGGSEAMWTLKDYAK